MKDFFEARRPHRGMTYAEYTAQWAERLRQSLRGLDKKQRRYFYYRKYNRERAARVRAAYQVSDRLGAAVEQIRQPQLWMVLTEDWCSDSAYLLPVIAGAARCNDRIDLRILRRDDNLDVMDQYLSHGTRGIPRLVAFTQDGEELFRWGPRPETARRLRERLKQEGLGSGEISKKLIDWYEAGGWHEADAELAEALEAPAPVAKE